MRHALLNTLSRLRRDEKGASLVEYGVALLVVVTVGVGTISLLGGATAENIADGVSVLQDRN